MADAALEREARVFSRALIGGNANDYVVREYVRGHVSLPLAPVQGFDRVLMRVAVRGPWFARLADAYACRLSPRAILRRKLALMLAVLESAAPSDAAFAPLASSALVTMARVGVAGALAVLRTVFAILVIGPLHLLHRVTSGRL